jgi:membrane fusion protein, multidrug efflux system
MKKLLGLLFVIIFLAACGSGGKEENQDLAAMKATLKEKRAALSTLKAEIKALEEKIAQIDTTVKTDKSALVTTSPLTRKTFTRYIEIQGSIQAENTTKVSSETGGRLTMFNLSEGDYVKKGQLIAKLDMEGVNKQISELQTRLSLAKDVYSRQKSLWDQKIGSEVQYLQAKNNVEALEKSIETVSFQLTKANVYAPASGMVNMTFVKGGEVVAPGMPLFDILNLGEIKVVSDVPEIYLTAIRKGQSIKIKIPALGEERTGRVTLIGTAVNPNNRTFKVEIKLDNAGTKLIPNLLTYIMLQDYTAQNAIVLTDNLIQQEVSGKSYVFIKGESPEGDIAKKVYVELGETYEGETEIKSGLIGSETIIVDGARGLVENEAIKIVE